jgi:hypothetical protein
MLDGLGAGHAGLAVVVVGSSPRQTAGVGGFDGVVVWPVLLARFYSSTRRVREGTFVIVTARNPGLLNECMTCELLGSFLGTTLWRAALPSSRSLGGGMYRVESLRGSFTSWPKVM